MATESNLGTVHVFPSEASFTTNSASVGTSDLALVKYPEMDFVVESYQNGTEWYRKYKSGWVEQGGYLTATSSSGNKTITFLVPFSNTNYCFLRTHKNYVTGTTTDGFRDNAYYSKATTTITVFQHTTSYIHGDDWYASGQGA